MSDSGSLIPFIPLHTWEETALFACAWVGLKPKSVGKPSISMRILRSIVPLTVSVAILAACTSTGTQTPPSASIATLSPTSASSVAGLAPAGNLMGVTTAVQPPVVQSYIAALIANQDDAFQLVEPGTGAYLFTQALLFINRWRGVPVNFVETVDGAYQGSGFLLSDFQVDSAGKIATFQRNHLPIDQVYVPGDGTTYKSSDGTLSVVVDSFRHFDIDAEGNISMVVTVSNTGTGNATFTIDKYTAGGVDYPIADNKDDAPPGEQAGVPFALGKIPGGGRMTITLTAGGTPTTFELDVPVLG
jgi:hypothetical protein